MARPRNNSTQLHQAVEQLVAAVTHLLSTIDSSLPRGGASAKPGASAVAVRVPGQRGPGKNNPRLKAAIRAAWARMTPAEHKERVRRMLAGRGIKVKKG